MSPSKNHKRHQQSSSRNRLDSPVSSSTVSSISWRPDGANHYDSDRKRQRNTTAPVPPSPAISLPAPISLSITSPSESALISEGFFSSPHHPSRSHDRHPDKTKKNSSSNKKKSTKYHLSPSQSSKRRSKDKYKYRSSSSKKRHVPPSKKHKSKYYKESFRSNSTSSSFERFLKNEYTSRTSTSSFPSTTTFSTSTYDTASTYDYYYDKHGKLKKKKRKKSKYHHRRYDDIWEDDYDIRMDQPNYYRPPVRPLKREIDNSSFYIPGRRWDLNNCCCLWYITFFIIVFSIISGIIVNIFAFFVFDMGSMDNLWTRTISSNNNNIANTTTTLPPTSPPTISPDAVLVVGIASPSSSSTSRVRKGRGPPDFSKIEATIIRNNIYENKNTNNDGDDNNNDIDENDENVNGTDIDDGESTKYYSVHDNDGDTKADNEKNYAIAYDFLLDLLKNLNNNRDDDNNSKDSNNYEVNINDIGSPQYKAFQWLISDYNNNSDNINNQTIVQRYILSLLYYSTQGSLWNNNTGWLNPNIDHCLWYSIQCDSKANNNDDNASLITHIELNDNNLKGEIISEIGVLPPLSLNNNNTLDDSDNYNLKGLKVLDLSSNFLTGTIPSELGSMTKLKKVLLYNNQLSGTIPSSLSNLQELELIRLEKNHLTGIVDEGICSAFNKRPKSIQPNFHTDCIDEIVCPCCQYCCLDSQKKCQCNGNLSDDTNPFLCLFSN